MLKVVLLAVGKLSIPWAAEGCDYYIERLKRFINLEIRELPASKEKDPERKKFDESRRILEVIEKHHGQVVALDERGKGLTSEALSQFLSRNIDAGTPILFIIGGAYGFTDEVRAKGGMTMRLSDMTLPHELCRIFFLEQLYRAADLQRGGKYHH